MKKLPQQQGVNEAKHPAGPDEVSRFFQFFAEKSQTVFWVRDPKGNRQLYVSPAFEKVWGRSCAELYKNPDFWIETVIPEDRGPDSAEMRLQNLAEKGPDEKYEWRFRIQHPDGRILWIKDVSFPIYDDNNEFIGFAGIGENITEDVLREQQLCEAMQRAEAANQAKSDFLAMMSHELRTPLNAILGMAQILRMKGINKELEECVDIIAHAGNSLLALVSDILDFAKLEVGKLSFSNDPLDLHLLTSQVVYSLHHQAQSKQIDLELDYQEGVPALVVSDSKRIRQVLANLIGNAIKFTDKGYVKVKVKCIERTAEEAKLCITVVDTGLGISEDKLDFIFEKFSQIDSIYQRKYQGTGLGLAITKELLEKMGGEISVHSQLGKGSEFSITLPVLLQMPSLEKSSRSNHFSQSMKKSPQYAEKLSYNLNILLVEDHFINQKIAKILLEEMGCKVEIIDSGYQALEHLQQHQDYDIIFMDIGLPDMSGFEVVAAIRQKQILRRNIPIIAMTAHILERDKQQCFAVGMDGIIAKPIAHEELVATLHYWAQQKAERVE